MKKTGKNHFQHYQNALKLGTISFKAFVNSDRNIIVKMYYFIDDTESRREGI